MRIKYIDVLKAFTIFTVILGHVCQHYGKNIEVAVYHYGILPYHMPMFAVMSGLFFSSSSDVKTFCKRKFSQIALPFFVWCFIVAIVIRGIEETYFHFTNGFTIHFKSWAECFLMYVVSWGWWFLRALFLSFIYAYFSIQLFRKKAWFGVIISISLLYMLSLTGIIPNKCMKDFVFLYPFFCTGILLKEFKPYIIKNSNTILLFTSLVFMLCMYNWQGYSDTFYGMNTSVFETKGYADITGLAVLWKSIYRYVTGASASVMFILLASKVEGYLPSSQLVMSIGRNTLGIYILHGFIFDILPPPDSYILIDNQVVSLIACLTISIIIIIICNISVEYTSRNRWLALLLWGRKKI